jgi:hypothetical protein
MSVEFKDAERVHVMVRLAGGLIIVAAVIFSGGWYIISQQRSGRADTPHEPRTEREVFASDHAGIAFDAKRAMGYLEEVCKIGPRISGTEGMSKQQALLQKHFEGLGGRVEFQRFTVRQKSQAQPVEMANLIVSWHPGRERRVILCSHYDTRPIADRESDRRRWREPFVSANDGGSGVALLMELAHHMKDLKTTVGVDFVFFDGEEYIFDPAGDKYFFGSEYFADSYLKDRSRRRYVAAVLFDMIGGKDARFPWEQNSYFQAAALLGELWQIAGQQKCSAFVNEVGPEVRDDHLALNKARIPAVDIIDFSYSHWHLLSDLPENCSGESLAQVARVIATWLPHVK